MAVVASLALGQDAARVEFEVAAIKPAPPQEVGRTSVRTSVDTGAGQLAYSNVNLRDVLRAAYRVQSYQISGPEWLDTERFDIVATFPQNSSGDRIPLMLQALLAERFHVVLHRETKDLPAYALTVAGGGSKLKPLESSGDNFTGNSSRTVAHLEAKATMRGFTEYLSQRLDRPVLDQTGLGGRFEFVLDWAIDDAVVTGGTAGPSIFTAVQEQLGLKLNSTKGPVETIVVDQADRVPTEN